jgi:hypothetical protein
LVTRALRGKPQSSVTRTTAPSRSSDWMRPIRWLRALLWEEKIALVLPWTIGVHGAWTPEMARKEARVLLGRVAQGKNPAE